MVNSLKNPKCRINPKRCWICGRCAKHHNCKDGADYCCTSKVSEMCNCRHCKEFRKIKEAKSNGWGSAYGYRTK